jgi:RNA polymerase sigma-70 factor, ECF subfamily
LGKQPAEDNEIICRLRNGDMSAVGDAVEKHGGYLYSFIFRMTGNPQDTEDIFQETWIKVMRNIGSFRGDSKFTTWVLQIALNIFRDSSRKRKNYSAVSLDDVANYLVWDGGIDENQISRTQKVKEIIDALPEKMRAVMILKYYHDMNDAEIGEIVGCPEGTVKSRIFRASKMIKEKWEKRRDML